MFLAFQTSWRLVVLVNLINLKLVEFQGPWQRSFILILMVFSVWRAILGAICIIRISRFRPKHIFTSFMKFLMKDSRHFIEHSSKNTVWFAVICLDQNITLIHYQIWIGFFGIFKIIDGILRLSVEKVFFPVFSFFYYVIWAFFFFCKFVYLPSLFGYSCIFNLVT